MRWRGSAMRLPSVGHRRLIIQEVGDLRDAECADPGCSQFNGQGNAIQAMAYSCSNGKRFAGKSETRQDGSSALYKEPDGISLFPIMIVHHHFRVEGSQGGHSIGDLTGNAQSLSARSQEGDLWAALQRLSTSRAHKSSTCSQLSRMTSVCRSSRWRLRINSWLALPVFCRPKVPATTWGTRPRDKTREASSTNPNSMRIPVKGTCGGL